MISVEKEIVAKFPKILKSPKIIQRPFFSFAKTIVRENAINDFLEQHNDLVGFDFVEAVLDYFDFDYTCTSKDIENIPANGRVVIIANHPLGALDALVLLKLISKIRRDVKIVANDFLGDLEAISQMAININNFKSPTKDSIKPIYEALQKEMAIVIFPAGEVSRVTPTGIKDNKWHKGFLKFALKTSSPILPVFINGKNSKAFYTMSMINKTFSTLLLSREMFKQQSKKIEIKVGEIIPFENIIPKNIDKNSLPAIYKKHVYGLMKGTSKRFFCTQKAIAHPEDRKFLRDEIQKSKLLGSTSDDKKIYLHTFESESVILRELGRLREFSFRKVGEGANKKRDTDKYDKYYSHIILWDDDALEIVGAYRICDSSMVLANYGVQGFYSSTLFEFQEGFYPYLKNSIELGRSFVQPKYWGTRALDYLWYGIGAYLASNPHIKHMFGPVSLSSTYPIYAQQLIVYFYSIYFSKNNLVKCKLPFTAHTSQKFLEETQELFCANDYQKDFKTLRKTLNEIGFSVPMLFKQYTEITENNGSYFGGFNIDPDFNSCIDGFIIVDIDNIKEAQKQRYIK